MKLKIIQIPVSRNRIESENFGFFLENSVTWVVKYEKLNFRKSQGIYYISFEN